MGRLVPFAVSVLLALAAGCAGSAVKTPTPAAQFRSAHFETDPPIPGERYYIMVFGSQSNPKVARYTHTWATVVRVNVDPVAPPVMEAHTISWMPATLDIHPWRFTVEKGVNLKLDETIHDSLGKKEHISMWGPYELRRGSYRKFLLQKIFMESGQVGYQCIDTVGEAGRTGNGCNCIHAITDMDALFDRGAYPLAYFGEAASDHMVGQYVSRVALITHTTTHGWLVGALNLDKYPIETRVYVPRRRLLAPPPAPSSWDAIGQATAGSP